MINIYTSVNNLKKEIFKDFPTIVASVPKKSFYDKPTIIQKIYKRNIREGFFTRSKKSARFE